MRRRAQREPQRRSERKPQRACSPGIFFRVQTWAAGVAQAAGAGQRRCRLRPRRAQPREGTGVAPAHSAMATWDLNWDLTLDLTRDLTRDL